VGVTDQIHEGVVLADRYRIRGRLGAGGMATVFLAEDCVLCRDVAVKRLRTEGSERDRQRFRREARLGASLIHPNLVTIFDTLSGPDGVLIVMEHVRGRPLSELIGPQGMDSRRLLEILRPLASALDYAHGHGVVHRDVKPANVLIAEDRRVKLVDLGTARAAHLSQITGENEVIGTLAYIAPERLAAESVGEPPADVYSFAVLAFEALSGAKPFSSETPVELLEEASRWPAPDLMDVRPEAPPRLASVLMQGMDPDPERRQASAGALVREFEAALSNVNTAVPLAVPDNTEPMTPPASEPIAAEPRPQLPGPLLSGQRRRPRWMIPALAAICAVLAVGAYLVVSGGGDSGGAPNSHGKKVSTPSKSRPASSSSASAAPATTPTTAAAPPVAAAPSTTAVPADATGAQLNDEGYSLIQQGRYEEAIPVLRRAVASFPSGTTDINYAYSLFNLGNALRLAGRPQEAIPVLERRLQIPDQTDVVQRELDAARAAAGE
jgi:eukaryotic-like serine/threonine-protein kinase